MHQHLENLRLQNPGNLTIIQGGAKGADDIAGRWANEQADVKMIQVNADWTTHGLAAGPIRNQQMLDLDPTMVYAFVDKPLKDSKGTADMVKKARAANVPVFVFEPGELDPQDWIENVDLDAIVDRCEEERIEAEHTEIDEKIKKHLREVTKYGPAARRGGEISSSARVSMQDNATVALALWIEKQLIK